MSVASEQASIALTVDVSGSMSADDVKPTRLGAAQEAIRRFLAGLPTSTASGSSRSRPSRTSRRR